MQRTHVATAWMMAVWMLLGACTETAPSPGNGPGPNPQEGPPLVITTESLPRARQGELYEGVLESQGGLGTARAWSLVHGILPEGLTLKESKRSRARIVGTPTRRASMDLVFSIEGEQGQSVARVLRLEIDSSLAIPPPLLAEGTEGQPYSAQVLATGGSGEGHQWRVVSGALPPGLSLVEEGARVRLSGTPGPGRFQFVLSVEDSDGVRAERFVDLSIRSSLVLKGEPSVAARARNYLSPFDVVGGVAPYRWSLVGTGAPEGLGLACSACGTVELRGVPGATGNFPLVLRVEDSNGGRVERSVLLRVVEPLEVLSDSLPSGLRTVPYSVRLRSRGGEGSKHWSIVQGTLPPEMTLTGEGDTALLQGPTVKAGSFWFVVRVEDELGFFQERLFSLQIDPNPPRIVTAALPEGALEQPYEQVVEGVAPATDTVSWKIVSGWLPPGLEATKTGTASLKLSGVARVAGTFPVTVELSADDGTARATYSVRIGREPRFELRSGVLPAARAGEAYTASVRTVEAEGGVSGWAVVEGTLPPGLALEPDGEGGARIRGTPGTAGFSRFVLQASDAGGHSSRKSFSLQVAPARRWALLAHSTTFSGARTITIIDLNDRTGQTRWNLGIASETYDFTFSPDGTWLSYSVGGLSGKSLHLADLRTPGAQAELVTNGLRGDRSGPALYSPDGRWMAYAVERGSQSLVFDQYVRDLSGVGGAAWLNASWTADYGRYWSPDGRRLLIHSSNNKTFLLWDTRGGSQTVQVTPELEYIQWPVVWSPDSRRVVFGATARGDSNYYRFFQLDLDQPGSARPFALTPSELKFNPNFVNVSPDGSRLSFTGETGGTSSVYVLDIGRDSAQLARMVSGTLRDAQASRWSPDSRHLLVSSATAGYHVVDAEAAEGAQPVPLATPGLGPAQDFARWAPDGVHVTYSSEEGLSLVRAVGAPSVTPVTPSKVSGFNYATLKGASRRVVYSDNGLYLAEPDAPSGPRAPLRLDTVG
ncbi:MAG: putative Ig domain-containing protein, partial [Cystobacter sp.]